MSLQRRFFDRRADELRRLQDRHYGYEKEQRKKIINSIQKGDILISTSWAGSSWSCPSSGGSLGILGSSVGDIIGHAAIMVTDNKVLEMIGGNAKVDNLESNNTLNRKDYWFDIHKNFAVTVYRCPNSDAAIGAADCAYRNYYNGAGGPAKTIHVKYQITFNVLSINPSYCSKLILQAYYYGNEGKNVIRSSWATLECIIVPRDIPSYNSHTITVWK